MMNMKNCMKCERCQNGDEIQNSVDNAWRVIEGSEFLLRSILVDVLDAYREVLIAALQEESETDCKIMMTCDNYGNFDFVTEDELELKYPEKEFSEVAVVSDGELIIAFDPDDEIMLGDVSYLIGPILIYEIDEEGNDINIDRDTIADAIDYVDCGLTEICVDDKVFPAFRLI